MVSVLAGTEIALLGDQIGVSCQRALCCRLESEVLVPASLYEHCQNFCDLRGLLNGAHRRCMHANQISFYDTYRVGLPAPGTGGSDSLGMRARNGDVGVADTTLRKYIHTTGGVSLEGNTRRDVL